MSVHEPHLVPVPLGDSGDEILDVREGGPDGGAGLASAEPGLDLELALAGLLVLDELEIKVEVLEVADELAAWAFHLDDLRVDLDLHPVGNVHGLRRKNGLHDASVSLRVSAAPTCGKCEIWERQENLAELLYIKRC